MSSSAMVTVLCNLVGVKQARDNETLTEAGWSKFESGDMVVYKNSVAWNLNQGKGKEELPQFARISCFSKRYEWMAKNLKKGTPIVVTGKLSIKPASDNGKSPWVEIEVVNIDLPPRISSDKPADSNDQQDAPVASAPAARPAARPAAKAAPADSAPQSSEDLPF